MPASRCRHQMSPWVIFDRSNRSCPPDHVRFADKPDTERDRLQSRLVCLDSLPTPQPMIFAKEEPHDDRHHYCL